jgi:glycerol-1-phosphate dehydrogenase [NAD(P)+]
MTIVTPEPVIAQPLYGRDLISALPPELRRRPMIFTQPEPWELVSSSFSPDTTPVHFVTGMDHDEARRIADGVGPVSAILGVGGGTALDMAKFTAWRRGFPLVLVPSILSVDAAFTKAAGVREGRRVRYVGAAIPERLLIDFDLLQSAPPVLNRAGAADVLSIFTALWDWREAAQRGEDYEAGIAAEAAALLERLYAGAAALREVTDAGLRLLSELFVGEVRLCEMVGTSRPEEGSEHYLAYCVEKNTGRSYIHGQLVGLCIDVVGRLQGQDVGPVRRYLDDLGLDCRLAAVGLSREELRASLHGMPAYLAGEPQLLPGVFHFRGALPGAEIDALVDGTA